MRMRLPRQITCTISVEPIFTTVVFNKAGQLMLTTDEKINQLNFDHDEQRVDFDWSPIFAEVDEQLVMCYTEHAWHTFLQLTLS